MLPSDLRSIVMVVPFLLLLPATTVAQSRDGSAETSLPPVAAAGHAAAPALRAVHVETPLVVDGRLDEAAWALAPAATNFTQTDPREGEPVTEPTEVRVLYDENALHIGARLYDSQPVSSRLGRRDDRLSDSDWFSVTLDSYHDHRTAFRFQVNPSGVRADAVLSGGDGFRGDDSWDPVWEGAAVVTDSGWTAELRIPFSQLRFSADADQIWGVQFQRTISRNREEAVFAFTPRRERGGIARFGHLGGLEGLEPGQRLEVLPYVLARGEYLSVGSDDPAVDFANPYRDGADFFGGMGIDVKYRPTSNLTLDATINPDFGQVEVDPAVVNLSAFETRFDEKRPFFVEGADIFEFGGGGGGGPGRGPGGGTQLFYSRRIGRPPPGDVPDEVAYSDAPAMTTILGAGKLTGKTADGWSIGILDAVTARETAAYVDVTGGHGETVVAPMSNYFVGRLKRDLRDGRTVIGAIATAANRDLAGTGLEADLRSAAYTAGVDFQHEWADRVWSLSGYFAASTIHATAAAIEEAQRSSARYFQRPDAAHLAVEPGATSLRGYAASIDLDKRAGLHWRGGVELRATSPGYEVNDLGFQSRADRIEIDTNVRYVENTPGDIFRDWSISTGPDARWNFAGDFLGAGLSLNLDGQLLSYWEGNVRFSHDFAGLDDRLTRGGPLARQPAGNRVWGSLRSDSRNPWWLRLSGDYDWDVAGGGGYSVQADLSIRPAESWSLSLGPEFRFERDAAQYIDSVEDPLATTTFGERHIFAELERSTLSLDTRLNLTFRPGLTLELYAQPLLASGDFYDLKQLRAPRTFAFDRYGADLGTLSAADDEEYRVDPDGAGPALPFTLEDEDFNVRSLRGNAVLRWEWRPGSTLFLVWQQSRSGETGFGTFDLDRDARALFRLAPENIFLIKMNYWLNP